MPIFEGQGCRLARGLLYPLIGRESLSHGGSVLSAAHVKTPETLSLTRYRQAPWQSVSEEPRTQAKPSFHLKLPKVSLCFPGFLGVYVDQTGLEFIEF